MGETHQQQQAASSSRMGMRSVVGGEIVEVQGGHIVRSTGRKDRHSKVCTAKGPRDRRVRLSAHTAIQFYDVQDRLGYDRPSKAVDWLIKKAKAAIDELAQLPAWNPTTVTVSTAAAAAATATATTTHHQEDEKKANQGVIDGNDDRGHMHHGNNPDPNPNPTPNQNPSFLPPSLDSDTIADTIKSFFPMGASGESSSSSVHYQSYPPSLLSRTSSQNQDLRLSLQSFQDPMLLHHHPTQSHSHHHHQQQQALFSQLSFDAPSASWSDHQAAEMGRFQRMLAWNAGAESSGGGGFVFNSPPTPTPTPTPAPLPLQPLFGQSQMYSQRGPLQSSNTPSIRAWIDPPIAATIDHHHHHQTTPMQPSMISGIGFVPGGFSGFRIPARIQGEEEHDGISDKPSSASSDSRH